MNWLRLYHSTLDSRKIQGLPDREFKAWVNMLIVASENTPRGALPPVKDLAFRLRLREDFVTRLISKFIRECIVDDTNGTIFMHDWEDHQFKSDDINQRVARHRRGEGNVTRNVTRNGPDTDTDTDTDKPKTIVPGKPPGTGPAQINPKPNGKPEPGSLFAQKIEQEKATSTELEATQRQWFMSWWKNFWRRDDKQPAWRAFKKHIRTKARYEDMLSAFHRKHAEMLSREPEKRPLGATWLNKEPWEDLGDETPPQNATNGASRQANGGSGHADVVAHLRARAGSQSQVGETPESRLRFVG